MFYGADGKPWFRLDEQRHDVPLNEIAARSAARGRRGRGSPLLSPSRHRSDRARPRRRPRPPAAAAALEGGSTLTQQLARTLFLSNVRTYGRKVKEAGIALLIEAQLTKTQILELYLNRVYLSAGVYGVETMSEHLFRKPAKRRDAAGGGAHRRADPRAVGALAVVELRRRARAQPPRAGADARAGLHHAGAGGGGAARVRPRIQPYRQPSDPRGGWAKDYLRQQFRNEFGGDNPPDWQVHTTFQPALQDAAERAVAAGLERLRRPGLEAALVAIDPATGDILAMVGGADYARSTYNRAVAQPAAARLGVQAARLCRGARARLLAGVGAVEPAPRHGAERS